MLIDRDLPIYQPIYPGRPTENIPDYLSRLTDRPANQPIHQGWLTDQPIYMYLVDWPSNILEYLILVDWLTNIPAYPVSGLTDQPTHQPIHPGWLTDQHTSLSKPNNLSGLIVWPTYQPIYLGWLCDQQTILVDWLINKLVSPSRLIDRPTFQPIDLGRLNNKHTWPSILVEWSRGILPTYPSWLTDQHTWLSIQPDWPKTHHPVCPGWLNNQHTSLSTQADWTNLPAHLCGLTDKPACLSGLTEWSTYQPIYPGWFTNKHTWPSILVDSPTAILAYSTARGFFQFPSHPSG